MNCPKCGVEVVAQSLFCHRCGASLDGAGPSETEEIQNAFVGGGIPHRDDPERELWQGRYSPKAMVGTWVGVGLATIAGVVLAAMYGYWLPMVLTLAVLWIGLGILLAVRIFSVSYRLTTQRLIHQHGLLFRKTDRIDAIAMTDITYEQGPIDRMLGVGTITIISNDLTDRKIVLPGIDRVKIVAGMIDDAHRAEQIRRGVRIENHAADNRAGRD